MSTVCFHVIKRVTASTDKHTCDDADVYTPDSEITTELSTHLWSHIF